MLPAIFVSHGAPDLVLTDAPAKVFLENLLSHLAETPKAILVASAHWETGKPSISAPVVNDTIYDFGGFSEALYRMRYPAPGSADLAERAAALLTDQGMSVTLDRRRGLDHGAWVPLTLMRPQADIPVAQISLQTRLGPAHHMAIGAALAPLRQEGVLVLGSGSFTHDLSEYMAYRRVLAAPEPQWVSDFADWFDAALQRGATEDVLDYRRLAPFAAKNHPTEEHLLPLYVAMGAAGTNAKPRRLHASTTHGVLRMDVYAFGDDQ
ncbi:MAG: dioxygenase [Alphaproteobacteria bacterium]|nr:MAG: dioxygenase [Alphaproteobacteria bacterium]